MGGRVMKRVGPDALSPGHRDCLPVWPATHRRLRSGAAPPPPPCGGGLVHTTLEEHSTAILTSLTTQLISLSFSLFISLAFYLLLFSLSLVSSVFLDRSCCPW